MKKPIYKKWWFWIIILLVIVVIGSGEKGTTTNKVIYTFESEEIGEFGKEIILNKNTDMPIIKYLYKLPIGTYNVSTTTNDTIGISVVKDEIIVEDGDYPENLNYVSNQYVISGNSNRIDEKLIKENIEITLKEDESVSLVGKGTVTFEKSE